MFLPWIIGEGEKSWVNRFKVNKYVIIDKPSQLDAGMFAPDFFSLKFDDDLFQNLKIEIMKNEKWKNAASILKNERTVNNSFNSIGLLKC